MIITQTPLRISFFGGGTDLREFYGREPGWVLSSAIDKYIYVGTTRAAAYLGLACEGVLPAQLDPVRHHFAKDWMHKMRPSGSA